MYKASCSSSVSLQVRLSSIFFLFFPPPLSLSLRLSLSLFVSLFFILMYFPFSSFVCIFLFLHSYVFLKTKDNISLFFKLMTFVDVIYIHNLRQKYMKQNHLLLQISAAIGRYGPHLMIVMIFVTQNNE